MKETFKKHLVRCRHAGHVEIMGEENWQRDQMPKIWRGKGVEENRNKLRWGLH